MASSIPSFTMGVPMFAHSSAFVVVPSGQHNHNHNDQSQPHTPSFPVAPSLAPVVDYPRKSSVPVNFFSGLTQSSKLHPPQNPTHASPKSTTTLILDHMLTKHARARCSQARCEVATNSLTRRPSFDHETSMTTDENIPNLALAAYASDSRLEGSRSLAPPTPADVSQARLHRQVAQQMEEKINALLNQLTEANARTQPRTSSETNRLRSASIPTKSSAPSIPNPSIQLLPDRVRTRLAISCFVNEFFGPLPTQEQSLPAHTASPNAKGSRARVPGIECIPACLRGSSKDKPNSPTSRSARSSIFEGHTFAVPLSVVGVVQSPIAERSTQQASNPSLQRSNSVSERNTELWDNGVQSPSTAVPNSLQHLLRSSIRCNRHIELECTICSSCSPVVSPSTSSGSARHILPLRRQSLHHVSYGTSQTVPLYNLNSVSEDARSRLVEVIPHFLQLSALVATSLTRDAYQQQGAGGIIPNSAVMTPGAERFSDDEMEVDGSHSSEMHTDETAESRLRTFKFGQPSNKAASSKRRDSTATNVLPTREWYSLLAALVTRAVLEGYLLKGWAGKDGVETLFDIGILGSEEPTSSKGKLFKKSKKTETSRNVYDPDSLPSVQEALSTLFASIGMDIKGGDGADVTAEQEFRQEMQRRKREFLNVPPDLTLSVHLEALSKRYPAITLEQSILRFTESLMSWQGVPEIEWEQTRRSSLASLASPLLAPTPLSSTNIRSPSMISTRSGLDTRSPSPHGSNRSVTSFTTPSLRNLASGTNPQQSHAHLSPTPAPASIYNFFSVPNLPPQQGRFGSPQPPDISPLKISRAGSLRGRLTDRRNLFSLGSKRPIEDSDSGGEQDLGPLRKRVPS